MALMPVADAQARVLAGVKPLPAERVPLASANGRVLAADMAARLTQPPFAASAMDGYAVLGGDVATAPARLHLVGSIAAGDVPALTVGTGTAARIFTGAPLPPGADTVVPQENTEREGDVVVVTEPTPAGRHVRRAGLDFAVGDSVLAHGRRLDFRRMALLAAAGHAEVPVHRRPRIGILATGSELVPAGAMPGPGRIVASSGLGVAGLVADAGGEPVDLGLAPDSEAAIEAALRRGLALGLDGLATLGGASVGEHDLVQKALERIGFALGFWKVAMRPGKPLIFGSVGGTRVLGLPGNPVSALVCGLLFLQPLVRTLAGRADALPVESAATLATALPANGDRQDYVRATLADSHSGLPDALPQPVQDSSMLAPLARADCLIVRPPHAPVAAAGSPCRIIRLER